MHARPLHAACQAEARNGICASALPVRSPINKSSTDTDEPPLQPGIYDIAPPPFPFPLGAMIAGRALSLQWPDATKVRTARTARLKLRVLEDILQSCHEIVDSRLARRSESAMKPRRRM